MRLNSALILAGLVLSTACTADTTGPLSPAVDHDAQGSWGENTNGMVSPGNSFTIAMNESDGVIVGTGSFAGEAGPFGGLAVNGTVANDAVDLHIVYVFEPTVFPQLKPDSAEFVGRLTDKDHIDGVLTRRGASSAFGLVRLQNGDRP